MSLMLSGLLSSRYLAEAHRFILQLPTGVCFNKTTEFATLTWGTGAETMNPKRKNNPLLQRDAASDYFDSLSPAEREEFGRGDYGLDELPDVTDTFTLEEVEAGLAACGLGKELKAPE